MHMNTMHAAFDLTMELVISLSTADGLTESRVADDLGVMQRDLTALIRDALLRHRIRIIRENAGRRRTLRIDRECRALADRLGEQYWDAVNA